MSTPQQQAREYYFSGSMTQKEIAQAVGVDEKTIYRWIRKEAWDKLKQAAQTMPAIISDNFCNQLVEMQNYIATREEGKRFPTIQEAETMRKLVLCITRMKETPSLGTNMEMMMSFTTYVDHSDHELCQKITRQASAYFKSKARLGFMPYQFAYGAPAPRPAEDELTEINEELTSDECGTLINEECVTEVKNKESSINDRVMVSAVEPRHMLNESTAAKSKGESLTLPTENCELKTESQSGIENQLTPETLINQATQSTNQQNTPCPPPGISGHFSDIQPTSGAKLIPLFYEEIPIPPDNVIWLGTNQVYDPQINLKREIKSGEANWLYKNGYIKR